MARVRYLETPCIKYRTRAIITRSRFETALDYKPRIFKVRKVSLNYKPLCSINRGLYNYQSYISLNHLQYYVTYVAMVVLFAIFHWKISLPTLPQCGISMIFCSCYILSICCRKVDTYKHSLCD